jgi:hypothetical protein
MYCEILIDDIDDELLLHTTSSFLSFSLSPPESLYTGGSWIVWQSSHLPINKGED